MLTNLVEYAKYKSIDLRIRDLGHNYQVILQFIVIKVLLVVFEYVENEVS